jgi:hypothetical protein
MVSAALFIAMGATAYAADVGSAPSFSAGQTVAVCFYSNIGTAAINVSSSSIFAEPGGTLSEVSETCGGTLSGLARCRTVANVPSNAAVWCRAVVDNKKNLRGRLEIRNGSGVTLTTDESR